MIKPCAVATLALLAALSASFPAAASVVEYTSEAAFDAAVTSPTTYNFDNGPFGSVQPSITGGGGVTFTPINEATQADTSSGDFGSAHSYLAELDASPTGALATLATAVTAVAFDFGSTQEASSKVTIGLSTGDDFNLTLPSSVGTEEFIGFTSSVPITSATLIDEEGEVFDIIDYTLASVPLSTPPSVPEPASLALLGSALIGFAAIRPRRQI